MAQSATQIWRDFETDGVPSSGAHRPEKLELRRWGSWIESLIEAISTTSGKIFATRALLLADLAHPANSLAWVYADPSPSFNGIYQKSGSSGSGTWTRVLELPYSFISAANVGAGSANAIVATTDVPIPDTDGRALITLPIVADNTTTPVTVAFNGGSALTIKTNTGQNIAVAGLKAGMNVFGLKSGSEFRLLNDQDLTAVAAQVQAALAEFKQCYLGAFSSDPTVDLEGNALIEGALYFNSVSGLLRVRHSGAWQDFVISLEDGSITRPKLSNALQYNLLSRRPARRKIVVFSDIQPILYPDPYGAEDNGGHVAKWRGILADMVASHGPGSADPAHEVWIPGDLVHRGTPWPAEDTPDEYGFDDLFAELAALAPLQQMRFCSGNHDYNYTGFESQHGNSFHEYEKWCGRLYHYVDMGKLRVIFMGSMDASVGGAIPDFVFNWWKRLVERAGVENRDVIVLTHHPLYDTLVQSTTTDYYIRASARFTDWMDANPGVVKLWISGHCSGVSAGGLLGESTVSQVEKHGAWHVNCGLHIPSYMDDGDTKPMSYLVLYIEDGSNEIEIERWNVETNAPTAVSGKNFAVTLRNAMELCDVTITDGRAEDPATLRGPAEFYMFVEREELTPGTWTPRPGFYFPVVATLSDQWRDDIVAGYNVGFLAQVPGDANSNPDQGTHSYGAGAAFVARRANGTDTDYSAYAELWASGSGAGNDSLVRVASFTPSGTWWTGPAALDYTFVGTTNSVEGVVYSGGEDLQIARSSGTGLVVNRFNSTGQALAIRYNGATVGGASVDGGGSSVTWATSSDASLKTDAGELTFEQARAVLDLIAIHNFTWKSTGVADIGVFAQELFEVYPRAVTVGGWFRNASEDDAERGEIRCDAGDEGAFYMPWGVDYSKLVPVLTRCLQGVLARQDAMEQRLAALEAAAA